MAKQKYMTPLRLVMFLVITIGGMFTPLLAQKQSPLGTDSQLSNSRYLETIQVLDDPYICFYENLRNYYSTNDTNLKWQYAENALAYSAKTGQYLISKKLIEQLYSENKSNQPRVNKLLLHLSDCYNLSQNGEEAFAYLKRLPKQYQETDSIKLRMSKCLLLLNRQEEYSLSINSLKSSKSKYIKAIETIDNLYKQAEALPRRSLTLAFVFSAMLPGSGQIYSGHLFDGLSAFGYCAILGGSSYAGWKYQSANHKYLAVPILTSAVFAFFYTTNLINAVESAERYNLYHQANHFKDVLGLYDNIIWGVSIPVK